MTTARTAMAVLAEAFAPLAERHILDIGCGQGALAGALLRSGARVTGVDPSADAIASARAAVPEARFEVADGADLPFPEKTFDGAVFLNSLHHVPAVSMRQALRQAARVTGPGRLAVVIEPRAEGSFFEVVRAVEDETEVRWEASSAIAASVKDGTFEVVADEIFERIERLRSVDELLDRLVGADPARASVVAEKRADVAAAFSRLAERDTSGVSLFRQPMRSVTLHVKG